MTNEMLARLGENEVKTMEDFAGCVPDDLCGWTERKDGETIKNDGFLEGIELSRADAETMIMTARVKAGWIDEIEEEPVVDEAEGENVGGDAADQPAATS